MEEQHIDRMEDLITALELMEPLGMASGDDETCTHSLAHAIREYHRQIEMLDDDDDELASTTCGYIYGHGGWHRYYLRLDGYVYFSEKHAHEPAISNAKALGFRIN